jgi:hypothetical protein
LFSLNFLLWCYLKDNAYANNPYTIEELHQNNEKLHINISGDSSSNPSDQGKKSDVGYNEGGHHTEHQL